MTNTNIRTIGIGIGFAVAIALAVVGIVAYPSVRSYLEEKTFQNAYSGKKDFEMIFQTWKQNQEFIRQNPRNDSAYYSLGQGYYTLQAYDDSIAALQKAIEINPKNDSYWVFLGRAYQAKKDYPKVIEAFTKALEIDPKKKEHYTQLAWLYYFRTDDQMAKAYDILKKGLETFPNDKDILWDITRFYAYDKNVEGFKKYAPQYLKLDPSNELVLSIQKEIKEKGRIQ